jgi:competence protein ComEC
VVVSGGWRNRYGHPAPAAMDRVRARDLAVARTDLEGTVTIRVAPGGTAWDRRER